MWAPTIHSSGKEHPDEEQDEMAFAQRREAEHDERREIENGEQKPKERGHLA